MDPIDYHDIIKLLLAVLVGGLIGIEREYRDKSAGFRTMIFICVGATLFTIFSAKMAVGLSDPTRIAANIVSGVGFLGAGVILRERGRVTGLTTAATIWLTAALGMGIGGGYYIYVCVSTIVVLLVLWIFPNVEKWIDVARETRNYEVVCDLIPGKFQKLEDAFKECNLNMRSHREMKRGDQMVCLWEVTGSRQNHDLMMDKLFSDPEIREFRF
jgi:putative Mg2+ transporter-C (MgtC) family protein